MYTPELYQVVLHTWHPQTTPAHLLTGWFDDGIIDGAAHFRGLLPDLAGPRTRGSREAAPARGQRGPRVACLLTLPGLRGRRAPEASVLASLTGWEVAASRREGEGKQGRGGRENKSLMSFIAVVDRVEHKVAP